MNSKRITTIEDPLTWLLEEDNSSVRYFTLKHVFKYPPNDPELGEAKAAILDSQPVQDILALQDPAGW